MLFTALSVVAGFLLGLRAGIAIGRKSTLRELAARASSK